MLPSAHEMRVIAATAMQVMGIVTRLPGRSGIDCVLTLSGNWQRVNT